MFSSGEVSTLGTALSAVRRRVRLRRAATGALLGAALAAGPTHLLGLPSLVPLAAIAAAIVALRRRLAPAAAWLDARDRDDLVLTATALIDHRARPTDLAATVVASAAARAVHTRPPSLVPAALALTATAALILLVRLPDTSSPDTPSSVPRTEYDAPMTGYSVPRTSPPDRSLLDRSPLDRSPPDRSPPAGSVPGASGGSAGVAGSGELAVGGTAAGDGAGLRGAAEGEATVARAVRELAVAAPVAGAGAEVAAVPARYRRVVAAYLEAR